MVAAERRNSSDSEPSISSPSDTLLFETPVLTDKRVRILSKRMDAFNSNRPGVTSVEIGAIKAKVTRQLGIFEKRRDSIEENMTALRTHCELDEFSKEFETLRLDFDVLETAVKIVNENLIAGDQKSSMLTETDKPRTSWEEYRLERQDLLCELEEFHLMVKLTLDRVVERSTARRMSAARTETRHLSSDRFREAAGLPESSRTGLARSDSRPCRTNSELRTVTATEPRELEESFEHFETVGSRPNSGPSANSVVPTFDVRLDKGHFKLTLPIFDGKHWEWDRFWTQYVLHIDSQNYPDSVKLNILRSHLTGEALDILETGSQDGTDLEGGKRALKFHYDNEAVKKAAILCKLDGVPAATNVSSSLSKTFTELKKLIRNLQKYEDTNTAHMRRTVRLKLPRQAVVALKEREDGCGREWSTEELLNAIEVYISTRRLDETHAGFDQVKLFDSERKGESGRQYNSFNSVVKNVNSTPISSKPSVLPHSTSNRACTLCGLTNHKSEFCRRTNLEQAEQAVRQNNLCRNCLTPGHRASSCTADPCSRCKKPHSIKLCRAGNEVAGRAGGGQPGGNSGQTASASGPSQGREEGTGLNYQGNGGTQGRHWNKGGNRNNSTQPGPYGQNSFRS